MPPDGDDLRPMGHDQRGAGECSVGQGCICSLQTNWCYRSQRRSAFSYGYKFAGAKGGTPSLFYCDDGAFLASSIADLQMMFDTSWLVCRVLGLSMGVKASGTKTAWSGTYWDGRTEKEITGWEFKLPDQRVIPQVRSYRRHRDKRLEARCR